MKSADREHEIFARLTPICRRQKNRALLRLTGRGLLAGSAIAVVLGLLNLALSTWPLRTVALPEVWEQPAYRAVLPAVATASLLGAPLLGAWLGLRRKPDPHAAAAAIDRQYQLQDRTTTALSFLQKRERKPLEEMQLADCMQHLTHVDARTIVQAGLPKPMPAALLLSVLGVGAIVGPLLLKPSAGTPVQPAPRSTAGTRPADQQPSSTTATTRASVAPKIRWRVAPPAEVVPSRVNFPAGATLEQIASDRERSATTAQAGGPGPDGGLKVDKHLQAVVEGEPMPWEHRETIRRYFEAIRPRQHEPPDNPTAMP